MAEIKVNSEMLRNASLQIKQEGANFSDLAIDFQQGLNALSNIWEGDAFNSFKAQLDSLEPSLERYSEVIQEYATFLETTAEQYEATETATQNETDNLVNNLFK